MHLTKHAAAQFSIACVIGMALVVLGLFYRPLFATAEEDSRHDPGTLISPEQMEASLQQFIVSQRSEIEDMRAKIKELEDLQVSVQTEINIFTSQDTLHSQLLLTPQTTADEFEKAIARNRMTSRALSEDVEIFQARYDSASVLVEQTNDRIELVGKQIDDIRLIQVPEIRKEKLSETARTLLDVLNTKKQLGDRILTIYKDLLEQNKAALEKNRALGRKLAEQLKKEKKTSLFTRSEPYRRLSISTFVEAFQILKGRINALTDPDMWRSHWAQVKVGGIARWAVFFSALTLIVLLRGRGSRFLQTLEQRCEGPNCRYRRLGLRLLSRSMFYLGMTVLFGVCVLFQLPLLYIGAGSFLFKLFLLLLLTRWGLDYLEAVPREPTARLRSYVTLHLRRFFRFYRAIVAPALVLNWMTGSGSLPSSLLRDFLATVVLIWAMVFWQRWKPVVAEQVRAGLSPPNPKWAVPCQWGTYLITSGIPLLSLAGYAHLAKHWGAAWIQTAAIVFWGWIGLNVIREWRDEHAARVAGTDADHASASGNDFLWALIHLTRVMWWIAMILGIVWAWDSSGFLFSQLGRLLRLSATVGSLRLSVEGLLLATLILFLTHLSVHLVRSLLNQKLLAGQTFERGFRASMIKIASYLAWGLGLVLALGVLGVNATSLAVVFGALSIGIGFGLQTIFNNFISGLILLFERPIQVGDYVEVGGIWAEVKQINVRATVVQTFDNASVIIPNSELISQQVTNWSFKDKRMRRSLDVGVAYGSDIDLVQHTLLEIAKANPRVLKHPEPEVLFIDHADSALIFRLRVWLHVDDYWNVPSGIRSEMDRRFRELGIEIAFPQRDLHIRTIPNGLAQNAPSKNPNGG